MNVSYCTEEEKHFK